MSINDVKSFAVANDDVEFGVVDPGIVLGTVLVPSGFGRVLVSPPCGASIAALSALNPS
jgi:hypothetical protein